jgi:type IX secretion system PorP/SprF family membrane protein
MKLYPLLLICCFFCASLSLKAQQDPMFTKYIFNPLAYNPAYAGNSGTLDVALLHRHQWWGIEGAPMTQNLTLHTLLPKNNIGLGLNTTLDQIGITRQFSAFGSFSYRIPLARRYHRHRKNKKPSTYLFIGLQGGVSNWTSDWTQLEYQTPEYDPAFDNQQPNMWLPNFGAGMYIQSRYWFAGFSAPMLVTHQLRASTAGAADLPIAQQYRHFYLTGGGIVKLQGEDLVLRPILLIKNVGLFSAENNISEKVSAPTEFDIDLSIIYRKMFWFGVAFRSAFEFNASSYDSVDFWFSVRLKNRLRLGVAYDLTLTSLRGPAQGSYEVLLGYDLIQPPAVNQPDYRPYKWF